MNYVYGPVPSRRLGFSLGVDVVPYKTCTLNCIYCQIGKTTRKDIKRKPYTPKDDILKETKESLDGRLKIDFIAFSGSGEPTLNSEIGLLIEGIKEITSIPVAVLTNSTLLFMEDVHKDLMDTDVVLPSLDVASQEMFKKINRPHNSLNIDLIIEGLKRFRKVYKGQIWLEIMLIKGFNDTKKELSAIKEAVSGIRPDKIHLNTVSRPPSEIYAEPLSHSEMLDIKNFFGEGCEVIVEFQEKSSEQAWNMEDYIIDMTKRRPVSIGDITNVLGISEVNAKKIIGWLKLKGKLKEVQYKEKTYYSSMIED
jgi:wyosine [tRNA(Phe)-imidazoG37] synthetase (radical SAM superfamily)